MPAGIPNDGEAIPPSDYIGNAGGDVWITEDGGASNTPKTERIVDASVLLTVDPGGERYRIEARDGDRLTEASEYRSTTAGASQ